MISGRVGNGADVDVGPETTGDGRSAERDAGSGTMMDDGDATGARRDEEGGLCARCLESRDRVGRGTGTEDEVHIQRASTTSATTISANGTNDSNANPNTTSSFPSIRPSTPVPIQDPASFTSSTTAYPPFVPSSFFPPGLIENVPSTSSTAYTQVLTPVGGFRERDAGFDIDIDGDNEAHAPAAVDPQDGNRDEEQDLKQHVYPDPCEPAPTVFRHGPSTPPTRTSFPHTEHLPNPLLDIGRLRRPSQGRGTLYPGSIFRGKQTSGRSSYEVEVRILDVDFPSSTLSGYLSISHLTDTHPKLTTFFSGEIVGEQYGFLTGTRYYAQATEQDDLRHWSRFDRFHEVKGELRRPGLTMSEMERCPGSSSSSSTAAAPGERERPYVFMRWKERFLVPDHKVRDISGASFAGFYYLQLELEEPRTSSGPLGAGGNIGGGAGSGGGRKSETVYLNGRPGARGSGMDMEMDEEAAGVSTEQPPAGRSTLPSSPPGFPSPAFPAQSEGRRRLLAARATRKNDRDARGEGENGVPVLKVSFLLVILSAFLIGS